MQIPILDGIYTDNNSDFRTAYPVNLIPVPKGQGVSAGYLRPAEGINHVADLLGVDRGGIVWKGEHYRVCGTKFIKISEDGAIAEIGNVQPGGLCSFDYSFDYLAINAGNALYLYNGTLKQVTDSNLGAVHDVIWVDGYFMTSDSNNIVVTELNNPFDVNPLKYGSSEVDPDPIVGLIKIRNEVYVLNRNTIEVFDNVGGEFFPFQRIDGAQTTKGTLSKNTACVYMDAIAMLGGGRNEAITVYISSAGSSQKIATREVEQILSKYTESQLTDCQLESRQVDGHSWLYIHLPDQTLVYDSVASQTTGQPTWFILNSGGGGYKARNMTYAYSKWFVGHTSEPKLGVLTDESGEHWGNEIEWQFGTSIVYNESSGAIFHQLELVALTGRNSFRKESSIYTQYSVDGVEWSMPKFISIGKRGERNKRLVWFQQGYMQNWRIQRFTGTSDARLSIARLEAKVEPLGV